MCMVVQSVRRDGKQIAAVADDFLRNFRGASPLEQRKSVRYQMRAPVLFKWTNGDGVALQDGGFTRDISTDGLFVCCDRLPPLQTALSMEVLVSVVEAPRPGLRLRGQGVVVRVEELDNYTGFAAKVDFDLKHGKMDLN